ncbi:MAG: glycosyl hydrolase, partial [Planctomycetota bacterium]
AWEVPAGKWKVMLFTCVRDGARGLVDYLDPGAVGKFIELTYQQYFDKFPSHFGTTIDSAFYDEPTFHWIRGGRAWTGEFNEKFRKKHGSDPVIHYPALWHDIGPETAAARNALFGFRAELYATGFPKVLNDWCRAHRIELTGHVDQEEIVNPVGLCGDLIKAFEHQDIPAIDQVFRYGRASKAYKIVSSAAYNYDRPLVLTECYGGIRNMPVANLYKEAMDQFAKGINVMVPHAVWYDPKKIIFQPDLSPENATYGPRLDEYNRYVGRLQRMLQGGRHVADIGVLYPIATLQAGYRFGPGKPYHGGVIPPEADYMDLGETLALKVRRDFTFVHPEVLDEKCTVARALPGAEIRLANKVNMERYKVFVIPGSRTIHWRSLRKIKAFYDQGGKVVATTRLPDTSAEFGMDAEVREAVAAMFGIEAGKRPDFPRVSASSSWRAGGYDAALAADGDPRTRWNAADGTGGDQWLEVDFGAAKTFGRTLVREAFDRTRAYRIRRWDGAEWVDCVKGERLGPGKTDTFGPVTASKVRLCIDRIASDSVTIFEFEVYDKEGRNIAGTHRPGSAYRVHANARGGKAWFVPSPRADALGAVLDDALAAWDVEFEDDVVVRGGNLSYIHKVAGGRHVYFFGNSSDTPVDTHVRLRGKLKPEVWDPHTGRIARVECTRLAESGQTVTRVRLRLGPVRSVFIVADASQ